MKICFVVSDFAPRIGGISTLNTDLAKGLALSDEITHVKVICLQGGSRSVEHLSPKLTVYRMPRGNVIRVFFTLCRELVRARDYDVFHSPNVFPVGFCTLLIARYLLRKPFVSTFFGTDVLEHAGSSFTRWAKRFTVLHANVATTISNSTAALTAKKYGVSAERFPIVSYSLPAHTDKPDINVRATHGFEADDIVVLTVCYLVKRKGVDDLICAVASITDPRVKLLVVGDGPERIALEALVRELGVESRVRFAGRVPEVDPYYHHVDIFALTSYYIVEEGDVEGFGIVFVEAEQHGVPVVGTRSGGIPETMIENETGFLADERDVPQIAAALERLAHDKELRHRMGEKGKQFVADHFSVARTVDDYVRIYERH